jgi:hypothetical protein
LAVLAETMDLSWPSDIVDEGRRISHKIPGDILPCRDTILHLHTLTAVPTYGFRFTEVAAISCVTGCFLRRAWRESSRFVACLVMEIIVLVTAVTIYVSKCCMPATVICILNSVTATLKLRHRSS